MDGPGARPVAHEPRLDAHIQKLGLIAQKGMILGLEPMRQVMGLLGHPEQNLSCMHVAGSNGKGSTCAFLASILSMRSSHAKVGLYTSPHLVSLTERVQFVRGGRAQPISESDLADALDTVVAVAPDFKGLSFFEAMTATGLVALSKNVSIAVVEAGLGARLDATLVVPAEVAVLTDLALEHTDILGDNLAAIAREKSAVARPHKPLVSAGGSDEALQVIHAAAQAAKARLYLLGQHFQVHPNDDADQSFDFTLASRSLRNVRLSLPGAHQGRNAALALQAAILFDPDLTDMELRAGLETAQWPGRMEMFARPGAPKVLLDGAHNAHGSEALSQAILRDRVRFPAPLHLVFGVLQDKDAACMLAHLAPLAQSIALTRPESPRARDPQELLALLPEAARVGAEAIADGCIAFQRACSRAQQDGGCVIVCGSLYLVGTIRAALMAQMTAT